MIRDYLEGKPDVGGEYRLAKSAKPEELRLRLGAVATHDNNWGNDASSGGEFAKLSPFHPSDLGGVAIQPPDSEPVIVLS